MRSGEQYEWGIVVFGENNKKKITNEMMRYIILYLFKMVAIIL